MRKEIAFTGYGKLKYDHDGIPMYVFDSLEELQRLKDAVEREIIMWK